jgi:hypothetical protein
MLSLLFKKKSLSKRAKFKESKYGFGGRKKRSKMNTSDSYADAFKGERSAPVRSKFGSGKGGKAGKNIGNAKGRGGTIGGPNSLGAKSQQMRKFSNKNKPKTNKMKPRKRVK